MKTYDLDAVEYIAKMADGGLRDSLSLLDKCLAYSTDLTLENVVKALGTTDYETMFNLLGHLLSGNKKDSITIIENLYNDGKDLKQFVHGFCHFILDICKLRIGCDWSLVSIPKLKDYEECIEDYDQLGLDDEVRTWLDVFMTLDSSIKYSSTPKMDIECMIYKE